MLNGFLWSLSFILVQIPSLCIQFPRATQFRLDCSCKPVNFTVSVAISYLYSGSFLFILLFNSNFQFWLNLDYEWLISDYRSTSNCPSIVLWSMLLRFLNCPGQFWTPDVQFSSPSVDSGGNCLTSKSAPSRVRSYTTSPRCRILSFLLLKRFSFLDYSSTPSPIQRLRYILNILNYLYSDSRVSLPPWDSDPSSPSASAFTLREDWGLTKFIYDHRICRP